ncbi:MAG: hypothetical protein AB7T27_09690 [Kiritimatiellia bacterium]
MAVNNTLRVYFGDEQANLYTIGYLSSDLFQLLTFSELIEQHRDRQLEQYFFAEKRPAYLNRYSKVYRERIKFGKVTDVEKGSVELIVDGIVDTATIIIPFTVMTAQLLIERSRQRVTFNVSIDDPKVQQHLDAYKRRVFGKGDEGLETFIKYLSQKHYDVQAIADRVYDISKITDQVSNRMARTLKMN